MDARPLSAADVAERLGDRSPRPVKTATITQYLWLRHKHLRERGRPLPGDIPEPDEYVKPDRGGHRRPCWLAATIMPWVDGRQPPGKPRTDRQPRQWRTAAPRKPGRVPARPRAG